MWQRGCFPTKTLIPPRSLHRIRDLYAASRTLLQCVRTRRRNYIGQLSPSLEYAPRVVRLPDRKSATLKLIHYTLVKGLVRSGLLRADLPGVAAAWRVGNAGSRVGREHSDDQSCKRAFGRHWGCDVFLHRGTLTYLRTRTTHHGVTYAAGAWREMASARV